MGSDDGRIVFSPVTRVTFGVVFGDRRHGEIRSNFFMVVIGCR